MGLSAGLKDRHFTEEKIKGGSSSSSSRKGRRGGQRGPHYAERFLAF